VEHLVARQRRHSDTLAERGQGRPRWPSRQEIVPGEFAKRAYFRDGSAVLPSLYTSPSQCHASD
jgi:hypothetical protein